MHRVLLLFLFVAFLATALQSLLRVAETRDQDRNRRSNPNVGLQDNGGQADHHAKRSNQKEEREETPDQYEKEEREETPDQYERNIEFLTAIVTQLLKKSDTLRSKVDQLKQKDDAFRSRINELKKGHEAFRSTINDLKMQIQQYKQEKQDSQDWSQSEAMLQRQVARLAEIVNASHILDPKTMKLMTIEDCEELQTRGLPAGTYFMRPHGRSVFCTAAGELLILRRKKGDVNFSASWAEYRTDFGKVKAEDEFVGYDFLTNFTRDKDVCLRRLTAGQLVLKKKIDIPGARREVVFSRIAPYKFCGWQLMKTMKLFTVPKTGLYTVTVGGSGGGHSRLNNPRPGGRGARIRAEFFWPKGDVIGAYAGCFREGFKGRLSGVGGDASWLIHDSRKILLLGAGAGGGGGRGETEDGDGSSNFPILSGLHGSSSPGDAWYDTRNRSDEYSGSPILDTLRLKEIAIRKKQLEVRAHDWEYVESHGGRLGSNLGTAGYGSRDRDTGGGGGGFEGGLMDGRMCCYDNHNVCYRSAGGGGSSFCNATESRECLVEEGGNGLFNGFIIIERRLCA